MGSEMCIRDSRDGVGEGHSHGPGDAAVILGEDQVDSLVVVDDRACARAAVGDGHTRPCLLYTSDAADERSSVDLGGRRIIKKTSKEREQLVGGTNKTKKAEHNRR